MKCKDCKVLTFVEEYGEKYPWCDALDDCPNVEFERDCARFERMSNADRISSMSAEEKADFFVKFTTICEMCIHHDENCMTMSDERCREGILQWMKSEAKE